MTKGNTMGIDHKRALKVATLWILVPASIGLSATAHAQCLGNGTTCFGDGALISNTVSGSNNSAFGFQALELNTTERNNSAFGHRSLERNIGGENNTAVGYGSLQWNRGHLNTAVGATALQLNSTGIGNTAIGYQALLENTIAGGNTAVGSQTMVANGTGERNTALGSTVLFQNESGSDNTGSGHFALFLNTDGNSNSAYGANSLRSNTTGIQNTASGVGSLRNNTTGFRNVAIGYQAGFAVTGSDNIVIGSDNRGKAADNGVIRIGVSANQKKTFVAGIRGVQTGLDAAIPVFIDANGQLGTIKSSAAVKEDINTMGNVSERLLALRPVTFRYKRSDDDGSKPLQFGLIAEEVAQVFPELVVYDEENKPETVSYHLLATLLVNEFQKDHQELRSQAEEIAQLKSQVARTVDALATMQATQLTARNSDY